MNVLNGLKQFKIGFLKIKLYNAIILLVDI